MTTTIADYSGIFVSGVTTTAETGTVMYKEYVVEKQKFGWNTLAETATLALGLITIGTSGYALNSTISSPKVIETDQPLKEGNTAKERLLDKPELESPDLAEETAAGNKTGGGTAKTEKAAKAAKAEESGFIVNNTDRLEAPENVSPLKNELANDAGKTAKEAGKVKTSEIGEGVGGDIIHEQSELKFGENDLVYGPSACGGLRDLRKEAGGKLLSDMGNPTDLGYGKDWLQFSKDIIEKTVKEGNYIHFDLTNMEDVEGILNGTSIYADRVTSGELIYIRDNWSRFSNNVKFYYNRKEVAPPWTN